jgi:hypothetical protein
MSSWAYKKPSSSTATTTARDPVAIAQASGRSSEMPGAIVTCRRSAEVELTRYEVGPPLK